jgi:flagellar hook assembly protein FlgD
MGSQFSVIALDADGYMWFGSTSGAGEGVATLSATKLSTNPAAVSESMPVNSAITGNYPNPFNPSTTIEFTLDAPGKATLAIYTISGQKVRELVSSTLSAGKHNVVWDGCDMNGNHVSSGIYISRLTMRGKMTANRMLLVK